MRVYTAGDSAKLHARAETIDEATAVAETGTGNRLHTAAIPEPGAPCLLAWQQAEPLCYTSRRFSYNQRTMYNILRTLLTCNELPQILYMISMHGNRTQVLILLVLSVRRLPRHWALHLPQLLQHPLPSLLRHRARTGSQVQVCVYTCIHGCDEVPSECRFRVMQWAHGAFLDRCQLLRQRAANCVC